MTAGGGGGVAGTADGLAKYPYVRESRRIAAEFTILERHVGTEARRATEGEDVGEATFPDSVGVGSYRIGVVLEGSEVEFVRCLDRRDIYRYFP